MTFALPPITSAIRSALAHGDPNLNHLILREGRSWAIYLNQNQRLLGRAYIWLRNQHHDMQSMDMLTDAEREELMQLLNIYRIAVEELWGSKLVDTNWRVSNFGIRGHAHLTMVPRYPEVPHFMGRDFPDERFNEDYRVYAPDRLPKEKLKIIVDTFREALK